MPRGESVWAVRLTRPAELDFQAIVDWTSERFGDVQARRYAETITSALRALLEGPEAAGVKARDDIAKGLMTLHVARGGRKGSHLLLLRLATEQEQLCVDVLRVLLEGMDLQRHVPEN